MKKQKPKYSTREYLGKFSKWLLIMRGRGSWRAHDTALERLFETFPAKGGVEQFTSVDIADYWQIRRKRGISDTALSVELRMLKFFWTWLIEDQRLPLNNPVRAFKFQLSKSQFKTRKEFLSLGEVNRLLEECPTTEAKRYVLKAMQGHDQLRGRTRHVVRDAALRAGLVGFSLSNLKIATKSRLNREVIQAYVQQLLNALPDEPKLESSTIATIESTTPNVWTTVSDYRNNLPMRSGVNQQ